MSSPAGNIRLICPTPEHAGQILEYRDEFSRDSERVTYVPGWTISRNFRMSVTGSISASSRKAGSRGICLSGRATAG